MSESVAVVGAGLVGALQACVMAKKGYQVDVYEYRPDYRSTTARSPGKVNSLAISARGLAGLEKMGFGTHVATKHGIPMYARMIHARDGSTHSVAYGEKDQCIYSVGRKYINEALLDAGENFPNLKYHFEHKLTDIDVDEGRMSFQVAGQCELEASADIIFGCDGAYSKTRRALMRKPWFNYAQKYIPHAYVELAIPPKYDQDGKKIFALPPNYLHIWPRGEFMMIALPNEDKSFEITMFMPTKVFDTLTNEKNLLNFFEEQFPDSICIIGREKLVSDYFSTKPAPLVQIKCKPYHWHDKFVIMGDAAHAMVPFYGQGVNCGLEDVVVLDEMMEKYKGDRLKAFEEYSIKRNPDAEAICDLAMYNYLVMRDLVTKRSFIMRKKLDKFFHRLIPNIWIPLYTTVSFSRIRYSECIENKKWQDQVLSKIAYCTKMTAGVTCSMALGVLIYSNRFTFPTTAMTWMERVTSGFSAA